MLVCELNRISSHLVWLATSGLELGAVSVMLYGFREREVILDIFEALTGLRMNHAYIRIGGVVMDLPDDGPQKIRRLLDLLPGRIDEYETLLNDNPIWRERNEGVGVLTGRAGARARRDRAAPCGPRGSAPTCARTCPYCGYETFEFDVPVRSEGDAYARYVGPARGDARVAEDRPAGAGTARGDAGPGDDRRPEGRLAAAAVGRARTGSATTPSTCATSWRSRWRP